MGLKLKRMKWAFQDFARKFRYVKKGLRVPIAMLQLFLGCVWGFVKYCGIALINATGFILVAVFVGAMIGTLGWLGSSKS